MLDLFMKLFYDSIEYRFFLLFIVGSCIGSFINVVVYRLPIMLEKTWRQDALDILGQPQEKTTRFNLLVPASSCPKCKSKIKVITNIPILGYFISKGRCLVCGEKISLRYPLVEFSIAVLFAVCAFKFHNFDLLFAQIVIIIIVSTLILIDYDTYLLPDQLTIVLVWLGLLINLNSVFVSIESSVLGAVAGYLSLWLIYWIFKLITKKEGMGYGDFKLFAAIGACFGVNALFPIVILASLSGSVIGVLLIINKKINRDKPIPFGPFLGIAALIYLFYPVNFFS